MARIKCNVNSLPEPPKYETVDGEANPVEETEIESSAVYRRSFAYTPAQDAVIIQMRKENRTYADIAEEIGRSEEAVRRRWYALKGYV